MKEELTQQEIDEAINASKWRQARCNEYTLSFDSQILLARFILWAADKLGLDGREDGPGEEDGPWAEGWAERSNKLHEILEKEGLLDASSAYTGEEDSKL